MSKSIHRAEYVVLTRLLREARQQSGQHQVEVAAALERTQSFVSDVETGARRLDLLELRDLCRVLEVDFLDFVRRVEQEIRTLPVPKRGRRAKTTLSPGSSDRKR
jgi:transcriptional regulator with XRE-family HTH domain